MISQNAHSPFSFGTFPAALFAEILNINYIRLKALDGVPGQLVQPAYQTLGRIRRFSAAQWGQSLSTNHDWKLLAAIHQVAVSLYCILSLQSLGVLPSTRELRDVRVNLTCNLLQRLTAAVVCPHLKRFVIWDLVVLGVSSRQDTDMRTFLREQLPGLGHSMGTYVPFLARDLLERFWALNPAQQIWDQCFDQPYTFVTHMSVDVSGVR